MGVSRREKIKHQRVNSTELLLRRAHVQKGWAKTPTLFSIESPGVKLFVWHIETPGPLCVAIIMASPPLAAGIKVAEVPRGGREV